MDTKAVYKYINDFCSNYKGFLTQQECDYVLRKFFDSYTSAIHNFEISNPGKQPTQDDENTILNSLMNDDTMNSFIDSAKSNFAKYKAEIENDYQKRAATSSFGKSILIGVIANFAYSIILLIAFWLGKDLIAGWLSSLLKP